MSICRICNHDGSKHFPECPFSNISPKPMRLSPPIRIDYWLATEDDRKRIKKDFEQGKYFYLGNGIFEEAGNTPRLSDVVREDDLTHIKQY